MTVTPIVLLCVRAIVCVLISLITLEICTRIDDFATAGAPLFEPYSDLTIYTKDQLGRIGKPNARYLKWQLNSLGYRGPETVSGRIRIVCLGASETFGFFEAPDNEYPRQLERELNSRAGAPLFDVVNASYPGMTIATHDVRVPYLVDRVHPRYALIYATGANYIWLPWLTNSIPLAPVSAFEPRMLSRAANILARLLPEDVKQWRRERAVRKLAAGYPVMDRIPEVNVQRYIADLERLLSDLRAHEVSPILMTHAYRFQEPIVGAERHFLTAWRIFYPMLAEDGFPDMDRRMNDAVRMLAQRSRTPLIDIDRVMPRGPKYFADFAHFTDAGSAAITGIVADALCRGSLIEELGPAKQK